MNIYLSSSWKNRTRVRALALKLRGDGNTVYDFTDPACRNVPEIPPERFPVGFDPGLHIYREYISAVPEWREAVECNRRALDRCDLVVLMLPCGNDAHADAYYALGGRKKLVVVGQPRVDERTPTHLWADAILDHDEEVPRFIAEVRRMRGQHATVRDWNNALSEEGLASPHASPKER